MTRDVLLVLAEYGREHEGAALAILTAAAAHLFPAASVRTVVVDNASNGGDNRVHEFSAWDLGLSQSANDDAVVVLANDTVVRPDKRARIEAMPQPCADAAARGALVGVVDEYPRRVEAFGYAFRQFVDTSFFMTTARTLTLLGPLAQPPADADVFDDDWRRFFREPSPLCARYRAYLRAYFFGEPIHEDFPHRWHGCAPVDASNAEAFRARIRCVFCEHLLSARASARGIPLVDIRPSPVRVERPRVSVVVPCYNLGEYVEETVDSVLAQSFSDFEIVVVDDGSTGERTIEVLDSLRRPKTRIVRAPHGGLAAARNLGIARTSGDYVCALDADDRLKPAFLETLTARLDGDPSIDFASCWLRMFGEDDYEWTPDSWEFPALLRENTVLTAALVRRSAIVGAGVYDTRMPVMGDEDWDLWLTLVGRGHRGAIVREVLFDYRKRARSMSDVSWYGEGHVPLASYRFEKHRDAYEEHLVDVMLFQDAETAPLLRRNDELERRIHSQLEPAIAAKREELAALRPSERPARMAVSAGEARIADLERALTIVDAEARALRTSMSWRITAPLRSVYGAWLRWTSR